MLFIICFYFHVYVCVLLPTDNRSVVTRSGLLELEVHVVVDFPAQVLGTKLLFSAVAMSVPNYWAISLATPPFIPVLIANINPQGIQ